MTAQAEIKHTMAEFLHINGNVRLVGHQRIVDGKINYVVTKTGESYSTPNLESAIEYYMKWVGEVRPCLHFGPLTGRPAKTS